MALTQSQVSALYIALLGRASEGEGSKYWLNTSKSANLSMADVARFIMNDKEAKANFATHFETPEKLVDFIYANAFGKGAGVDQEGKAFWINHLKNGVDQATIVSEILKGALAEKYAKSTDTTIKNDFSLFINKIAASNMVSESVEKLPGGGIKALQAINKAVKPATKVAEVKNLITANETLKSAVDTTKLEKAATANDPAKVIANVTGAKVEEITKILKENPVVSTDGSGDSNAGADSNAGSNVNNGIDEIIVPAPGSGSGGSETPTVTIAQADLANTAATNLKIADSAAHIQGALADLVTHVAKVASINASDDGSEIEMTKAQFDALKDKLDAGDTIKVTGLAAGDVAIAENAKVDSFTMNGGDKLTVTVAQAEAVVKKADSSSLKVVDSATNVAAKIADLASLVSNGTKINAIEVTGTEALKLTATQYSLIQPKLTVPSGVSVSLHDVSEDAPITASAGNDTFVIKGGAAKAQIGSFAATDKVNLSKVFTGAATSFENDVIESGTDNAIAEGKAYFVKKTDLTNAFDAMQMGGATDFDDLFGSGKLLADTSLGEGKSALIVVQVAANTVQVYKIAGTTSAIANTDVIKVATITGTFDSNLRTNFVLENAGEDPASIPGIDTPVEIPAEADGFYELLGGSELLVKLGLGGSDKLFEKLGKFYKGADADHATTEITDQLPIKEVKLGDSHYVFATTKNTASNAIGSWDDAAIIALTADNDTLTTGGLTYKFNASHKVKEVKKGDADLTSADIAKLDDTLAGKFVANGIAFAAGINNYAFTTENLAKMATLVGAGDNPFADDVIAKVADGATITAENFKKLDDKIAAAVTTLKATDLAAGDVAIAKNGNVDSFTMDSGAKLTVEAADVEALKTKAGAATDVFAVSDTASNIKNALADLVTNVAKVASIAANDSNTITVNAEQLTALKGKASDNALGVEGKGTELKATLVALSDSELAKIKNASIDLKGETAGDDGEIELTLAQFIKLGTKFSGTTGTDTITVTGVTGGVAASAAKDVFKLGVGATGLNITGFAAADKIDVTALITGQNTFAKDNVTGNKVADEKFYVVDGSSIAAITATSEIDVDFGELFGNGKTFKATGGADAEAQAIVAVKLSGGAGYKLYAINNAGDSEVANIAQSEVTLVGTVAGTFDSNIEDNFVLTGA